MPKIELVPFFKRKQVNKDRRVGEKRMKACFDFRSTSGMWDSRRD